MYFGTTTSSITKVMNERTGVLFKKKRNRNLKHYSRTRGLHIRILLHLWQVRFVLNTNFAYIKSRENNNIVKTANTEKLLEDRVFYIDSFS